MAHDRLEYLTTRRPDVAACRELSHEYWYRPRELLVDADDVGRIEAEFRGWEITELRPERAAAAAERAAERTGIPPRPVGEAFEAAARRGLVRFETAARMDVPSLVQRFRERPGEPDAGEFEPRVAPHHVLMGEQVYVGSPADDPEPAGEEDWEAAEPAEPDGSVVAVLDTGLAPHAAIEDRCEAGPGDAEVVDEDGDGVRDDQAGHGTFVAGRVLASAPGTRVRALRVLDSWGVTDELTLAACLDRLDDGVDVVNLSLGGYTHDNTAPMALSRALGELPPGTAVVAAAGNYGRTRPFWPAALKRCVAVAALDGDGRPAKFTNFGWWVDACAPGAAVASTFLEFDDTADGGSGRRFGGWARWSGTSFATPRVASAIAAGVRDAADARDAASRLLRESPRHPRWGVGVVIG